MNAHQRKVKTIEAMDTSQKMLQFYEERLNRHRAQICCILRKKAGWAYSTDVPEKLLWATTSGKLRLEKVGDHYLTIRLEGPTKEGVVRASEFQISAQWLHLSVWQVSSLTRKEWGAHCKEKKKKELIKLEEELAALAKNLKGLQAKEISLKEEVEEKSGEILELREALKN